MTAVTGEFKSDLYCRPFFRVAGHWEAVYVMLLVDKRTAARSCKIGYSNSPARRLEEVYESLVGLSRSFYSPKEQPFILQLLASFHVPDARDVERRAHKLLREKCLEGEWFDVEPEEAISAVMQAVREVGEKWDGDPWTRGDWKKEGW